MKTRFITKKRILGIVFALLMVLLGPYLVSRLMSSSRCLVIHSDSSEPVEAPTGEQLRVACFNIAHGRGVAVSNWDGGTAVERTTRLDQISELLRKIDADVVVLNEVDFDSSWSHSVNQAEYLANRSDYPYRVEQRNLDVRLLLWKWRFGNAILSRYPITNARTIDYPSYATWETVLAGKKRGSICDIQIGERTVRVVGAHLSPRSESVRVESSLMVSNIAAKSSAPVIVAGDFNSTLPSFPQSATDQRGRNALAMLTETGPFHGRPSEPPDSTGYTFHATEPRSVIDWILVPRDWQFVDYRVVPTRLSDHRCVWADVAPIR
jgi:endonuclease/exonuclease/phosphatase family metal-dependent hydrolase